MRFPVEAEPVPAAVPDWSRSMDSLLGAGGGVEGGDDSCRFIQIGHPNLLQFSGPVVPGQKTVRGRD